MERLFSAEKNTDLADAAELRGLLRSEIERTEHGHVLAGSTATKSRGSLMIVALGGLALLVALLFVRVGRAPAPVASVPEPLPAASVQPLVPAQPPAPATVDIAVVVSPPGIADVEVEIAGVSATESGSHRLVPRSTQPVRVRVSAPGYRAEEVDVVPERDQSLLLSLTRLARVVATTRAKAPRVESRPPAESPGVIKNYPF